MLEITSCPTFKLGVGKFFSLTQILEPSIIIIELLDF